jgi:hypothetical protein
LKAFSVNEKSGVKMSSEEYNFIREWLQKEPNHELVVPYIKEQKELGTLSTIEVDSLRDQVLIIMKYGHAVYIENKTLTARDQIMEIRR